MFTNQIVRSCARTMLADPRCGNMGLRRRLDLSNGEGPGLWLSRSTRVRAISSRGLLFCPSDTLLNKLRTTTSPLPKARTKACPAIY